MPRGPRQREGLAFVTRNRLAGGSFAGAKSRARLAQRVERVGRFELARIGPAERPSRTFRGLSRTTSATLAIAFGDRIAKLRASRLDYVESLTPGIAFQAMPADVFACYTCKCAKARAYARAFKTVSTVASQSQKCTQIFEMIFDLKHI